jgi:hypothetical protein
MRDRYPQFAGLKPFPASEQCVPYIALGASGAFKQDEPSGVGPQEPTCDIADIKHLHLKQQHHSLARDKLEAFDRTLYNRT